MIDPGALEHLVEVLPLEAGDARGLGDVAVGAAEELGHAEVLGPDAVEGRQQTVEDVVAPPVPARPLDGDDVLGLGHDADEAHVAPRVRANGARIGFGQIAADAAKADLLLDVGDALDFLRHLAFGFARERVAGNAELHAPEPEFLAPRAHVSNFRRNVLGRIAVHHIGIALLRDEILGGLRFAAGIDGGPGFRDGLWP